MKRINKIVFALVFMFGVLDINIVNASPMDKVIDQMVSREPEIRIESADVDKYLKELFKLRPELEVYFGGYSGVSYGRYADIKLRYINENINLSDIHIVNNDDELKEVITRGLLYSNEKFTIVRNGKSAENIEIEAIFNEIENENPICFMSLKSYNCEITQNNLTSNGIFMFKIDYRYNTELLNQHKKQAEAKAFTIVKENIAQDMPDYMKVKIIHDYIVENCEYATNYGEDDYDPMYHNIYGTLINGVAVCEGYTNSAKLMLNICGIENYVVEGVGKKENHTWNIVKLGDEYYHMDITWDDPVTSYLLSGNIYDYYNITDAEIAKDHTWNKAITKPCNGTEFNYKNTKKLISEDKNVYTMPFTQSKSVFDIYKPLEEDSQINTQGISQEEEDTEIASEQATSIKFYPPKDIIAISIDAVIFGVCSIVTVVIVVLGITSRREKE